MIRLTAFATALLISTAAQAQEYWPTHEPTENQRKWGAEEAAEYRKKGLVAADITEYSSDGPYLDYRSKTFRTAGRVKLDEAGLPMVKYGKEFEYNPVTISNFALASHARFLTGNEPADAFIAAVDKLVAMQRQDGAFPYDFEYDYYLVRLPYRKGWVSGMAQGLGMSALARAYSVTKAQRYLDAGNEALEFLQVRHPYGPATDMSDLDPSLSDYIFFQEYMAEPHAYTLNGYMFTLLGLYDWSRIAHSERAEELFESGIRTLEKILPYYDLGTFSSYDLGYITHAGKPYQVERRPHFAARYHAVHIELLQVLSGLTGSDVLARFRDRWAAYVR